MPKFDLEMAKRLLDGKFYDMDEEEEGQMTQPTMPVTQDKNKTVYASTREGLSQTVQLENF
jgi:hypothetical protein